MSGTPTKTRDAQQETRPQVRGRPFTAGNAGGPGRPPLSPAERERRRLARQARALVVVDVAAELRAMVGPALERLRQIVDAADDGVALRAATDIVDRVNGKAISHTELAATISTDRTATLVSPEMLRLAAMRMLARQAEDTDPCS